MENNSRKGIFYGLVGVATLVVAIIGATYAYFSVTQTSDDYLYGKAATAGLNVNVVRMTGWSASEGTGLNENTAAYVMVPQLDTTLDQAILGTDGNECIDAGGSLVCSIYRIVVQNTGSAPITVEGSIEFYGSTKVSGTTQTDQTTNDGSGKVSTKTDGNNNLMNHLKWARLTQPTTVVDGSYTYAQVVDGGALDTAMPTTLLTYENTVSDGGSPATLGYQKTPDNIVYSYQNVTSTVNKHFYAMDVTVDTAGGETAADHIDLLNGHTVTGAHGKYTDLIDPTGDLTVTFNSSAKTATVAANASDENGKWYLKAKDNLGDTKVFYIVVWISENKQSQNEQDFGQFTGTVTFNSSAGSGASSTFTETVGS